MFTKKSRVRAAYIREVRLVLRATFPAKPDEAEAQNEAWEKWASCKSSADFDRFMSGKARDVFKARALSVLLSPHSSFMPYACGELKERKHALHIPESINFALLPPTLQNFAVNLLVFGTEAALELHDVSDFSEALGRYNPLIPDALSVLKEDDERAPQLASRYRLNDVKPWMDSEDASGYNPFFKLLMAKVPDKWKEAADERMKIQILHELCGDLKPRRDWEAALPCYARHVRACVMHEPLPYSAKLLASQIGLIWEVAEQKTSTAGRNQFDPTSIIRTLKSLGDSNHQRLRRQLLQYVVPWCAHSLEACGVSLDDARYLHSIAQDAYFAEQLLVAIRVAEEAEGRRVEVEREAKERERVALAAMM